MRLNRVAKCIWRGCIKAPTKSPQVASWNQNWNIFCTLIFWSFFSARYHPSSLSSPIPLLLLLPLPWSGRFGSVTPRQNLDFCFAACEWQFLFQYVGLLVLWTLCPHCRARTVRRTIKPPYARLAISRLRHAIRISQNECLRSSYVFLQRGSFELVIKGIAWSNKFEYNV